MSWKEEREKIYAGDNALGRYRLRVGEGDVDGAELLVSESGWSAYITVEPEDMLALAAQLTEAAEEVRIIRISRILK